MIPRARAGWADWASAGPGAAFGDLSMAHEPEGAAVAEEGEAGDEAEAGAQRSSCHGRVRVRVS